MRFSYLLIILFVFMCEQEAIGQTAIPFSSTSNLQTFTWDVGNEGEYNIVVYGPNGEIHARPNLKPGSSATSKYLEIDTKFWPVGTYRLQLFKKDQPIKTKKFRITEKD